MPRALVIAAGLVAVTLMTVGTVWATHTVDSTLDSPASEGRKDFAVGGFERETGQHVGFSGHSGPMGEDPGGHLSGTLDLATGPVQVRFRVTCLAVLGNKAALGLLPTEDASNDQMTPRILVVTDSGLPGGTGDTYAVYVSAPQTCPSFIAAATPFTPLRGNIVVHDAIPEPEM
jgi:hypothetical protein